jgi:hypothetical protein
MPDAGEHVIPLTRQALAVLRHPEPSAWAVVLDLALARPVHLADRLVELHRAVPIIGASLTERGWERGPLPRIEVVDGLPLAQSDLLSGFHLHAEPPLRITVGDGGSRVTLVGHHAAFDGLGLLAVATALVADRDPAATRPSSPSAGGGRGAPAWARMAEVAHPADRVAPSGGDSREVLTARRVMIEGPAVTSRTAAACVTAVGAHNRALGSRWRRVGLSIAVGGPPGIGNVATYRRIDLLAGDDVAAAVTRSLAAGRDPVEFSRGPAVPPWAAPLARRLSDSFLVSNLGRHDIPGVRSVAFYPVARGRSAVAFGLAGLAGGASTITLRSLHLSAADADRLLDDVVRRLGGAAVALTEAEGDGPRA